jgi:broad specificity phosphatase PhoE
MLRRILLIRHGQTDWAKQKRYCGKTDVVLNEEGILQAKRLSGLAESATVEKVYTSDLKRTIGFAQVAFKKKPLCIMPQLREMDFGLFEGRTYEQLTAEYGEKYARWVDNPLQPIPEAEDFQFFVERVRKGWTQILSENTLKTIAVVTHAGPLSLIVADIRGDKKEKMWGIKVDVGSISRLELAKGKCRVCSVNDTAHLKGLAV